MIRINLLPGPRAKAVQKQQNLRTEVSVGLGVLVLTLGICLYFSWSLDRDIESRQFEKQEKEKQLALLKDKVKQVQDFEARKKLLEDKNRIIEQLQLSRSGPVRILDYVSQSLDPLRLWLVRLNVKGQEVEVEGRAWTNDDVVEFVNNLRRTEYFTNIRLIETRSGMEGKLNVYQFRVNFLLKA